MNRYGVFSFLLLLLLAACGESHEQMLRQLEELERMNRADSVMLNDTLARQLTQYFDRHGDSNERMRAHITRPITIELFVEYKNHEYKLLQLKRLLSTRLL